MLKKTAKQMDNWTNEFAPSKMKVKTMGQSGYSAAENVEREMPGQP